jgi:hypothetical protein
MNDRKAMTLRLSADQHRDLAMVAKADGHTINEAVLVAIEKHIELRKDDPEFCARLKAHIEDSLAVLERLR